MTEFIPYSINVGGNLLQIDRPMVMGILNITPDSFYSRSRCVQSDAITARVAQIFEQGADIIDVGGYSSRQGADNVTPEEEFSRLVSGIDIIKKVNPDAIISIDTFRAEVVRRCYDKYGPFIVNDISGGNLDASMFSTIAELHLPYILMHMRGTPQTMMSEVDYNNLMVDVISDLAHKVRLLNSMGVADVIIDPGFGFSKTVEQNYKMMADLEEFHSLDKPLLVGISRKSMIYRPLNITPEESLPGTVTLNTVSLLKGAHILRVHDVKAAVDAVSVVSMLRNEIY